MEQISLDELQDFEELTREIIGEVDQQDDLQFVKSLSEDRRLAIRRLLAAVSRHRNDYTFEL